MKNTNLQHKIGLFALVMILSFALVFSVQAARDDCGKLTPNQEKPIKEVGKDDPNGKNDYIETVEEDDRPGVTYLALNNGSTPKANKCGLKPSNADNEWTGWGGPLEGENVTIGEGIGTRNEIVIGGIYFPRGIGAHAIATLVYDLTGDNYLKFEGYVGMSDEKDPAECGHGGTGDFIFNVDGKQVFKSETLMGTEGGKNVPALKVEFDIPANAKELEVVFGDGGDGIGCDHSTLGDGKLLNAQALAVEPANKLPTIWGAIKSAY